MRGFRCNLVYTRAASRSNVVPLFASRIQAIRSCPLCLLYVKIAANQDQLQSVKMLQRRIERRNDSEHTTCSFVLLCIALVPGMWTTSDKLPLLVV